MTAKYQKQEQILEALDLVKLWSLYEKKVFNVNKDQECFLSRKSVY